MTPHTGKSLCMCPALMKLCCNELLPNLMLIKIHDTMQLDTIQEIANDYYSVVLGSGSIFSQILTAGNPKLACEHVLNLCSQASFGFPAL